MTASTVSEELGLAVGWLVLASETEAKQGFTFPVEDDTLCFWFAARYGRGDGTHSGSAAACLLARENTSFLPSPSPFTNPRLSTEIRAAAKAGLGVFPISALVSRLLLCWSVGVLQPLQRGRWAA